MMSAAESVVAVAVGVAIARARARPREKGRLASVFEPAAFGLPEFRQQEVHMRKILTASATALALLAAQETVRGGQAAHAAAPTVTAVSGPSWLHYVGVDVRDTSLGRGAG